MNGRFAYFLKISVSKEFAILEPSLKSKKIYEGLHRDVCLTKVNTSCKLQLIGIVEYLKQSHVLTISWIEGLPKTLRS